MGPEALAHVLRPLQGLFRPARFPALLVGLQVSDDAAVYRITDDVAVIQTLDFFTPVVDDPYDYGAIAATNAMSDVHAMGAEVALALNICGFPPKLPEAIIAEILRGGALAGGHACTDITGFALLGHSHEMAERSGARLRFHLDRIPFLDGAARYADEWLFPAGTCRDEACFGRHVTFAPHIPDELQQLLFTPETSGGLLLAVAPERADALAAAFAAAEHPLWFVGR